MIYKVINDFYLKEQKPENYYKAGDEFDDQNIDPDIVKVLLDKNNKYKKAFIEKPPVKKQVAKKAKK